MIPLRMGTAARRRPRWLGQAPEDWLARASRALAEYDRALAEAATIADDEAIGAILERIGRADAPGASAERYEAVRADAAQGAAGFADEIARRRVEQLEAAAAELASLVAEAKTAHGTLPAPESGAGGAPGGGRTAAALVAGGIALLGLVVVPLLVLD